MPKPRKTLEEFFWERVPNRGDGCWEWSGGFDGVGYGKIVLYAGAKAIGAHRASIMLRDGLNEFPEGMYACHHCDNRKCVRPDHLFVGTQKDNIQDARKKGRLNVPRRSHLAQRTRCSKGHLFNKKNTLFYKTQKGTTRLCRPCRVENQRKYIERKRCKLMDAASDQSNLHI